MQSDALCVYFNHAQYCNLAISRNHDVSNALYNGIELKNDKKLKPIQEISIPLEISRKIWNNSCFEEVTEMKSYIEMVNNISQTQMCMDE